MSLPFDLSRRGAERGRTPLHLGALGSKAQNSPKTRQVSALFARCHRPEQHRKRGDRMAAPLVCVVDQPSISANRSSALTFEAFWVFSDSRRSMIAAVFEPGFLKLEYRS